MLIKDSPPEGILGFIVATVIFLYSLYIAAWITAYAIRPIRRLFDASTAQSSKDLIGQKAIVRTSRVDENFGEAVLEDGGAGLILKVRTTGSDTEPKKRNKW